jgi:protein-disulfide isomerase
MSKPAEPAPAIAVAGLRALCACALAFSVAAAIDAYGGVRAFCAPGAGCAAVRASRLGQSIGVALPALGMIGFALVLGASLATRGAARQLSAAFAVAGGIAGGALLLAQALVIGRFCTVCVGADGSALGAGACALLLLRRESFPAPGSRVRRAWSSAALLAAGGPLALSLTLPAHVPAYVAALAVPGKIDVVEVSDFECPYCRAMHPVLRRALGRYGARVHFVRKSYPLPGHMHARDAARAYLCAQAQQRGEPMADWLFASSNLGPAAAQREASALGLDPARFAACVRDPATDRAIDAQMAVIRAGGFEGLPLVFIGDRALLGFDAAKGERRYAQALARAAGEDRLAALLLPWGALLALAALLWLWPARAPRT